MKFVNAKAEILTPINSGDILRHLEVCGRTCYKSEGRITDESAAEFVRGIIKRGHETVLEHISLTVRFTVDRGVSHELVRHRIASFSQESTRYCNYGNTDDGCTFIRPFWLSSARVACVIGTSVQYEAWRNAMRSAEVAYLRMLECGATPQEARSVLPNSLKTEVVMTANLREWRHFFKLRALGASGKPHPQMLEVAVPLLHELQRRLPVVFEDLEV